MKWISVGRAAFLVREDERQAWELFARELEDAQAESDEQVERVGAAWIRAGVMPMPDWDLIEGEFADVERMNGLPPGLLTGRVAEVQAGLERALAEADDGETPAA